MTDEVKLEDNVVNSIGDYEPEDSELQKPLYNKIQMSDVVKREKQKAYERGQRDKLMELQNNQEQSQDQAIAQSQSAQQPSSIGGMRQLTSEDIERMIAEKAPQVLQNHVNNLRTQNIVDSFVNKMQSAESKYPGIQDKLNDLDYSSMAPIVEMANEMGNTADIMNELIENPMKMGNLLTLMYTQPKLAQKAMIELSSSIKQNEDAKTAEANPRSPLSQMKPSSSAGMDNGDMSVSDFRKMFR